LHIPDGYFGLAVSAGAGVAAAGGLGAAVRASGRDLADRQIPLAGLTAAFIFALQMLNFPIGIGVSGHLLGGALAAILLGPRLAVVAMSVVVIVQALIFADGGISALGLNLVNMALVGPLVGWVGFRLLVRVLPRRATSAVAATMVAGWVAMMAAAVAFVLEYLLGGQVAVSPAILISAMAGFHALIGLGEGLISATLVGAVLAVRPDLVKGVQGLSVVSTTTSPTRRSVAAFVTAGVAIAVVLVVLVGPLASSDPDGLETVARRTGIDLTVGGSPGLGPEAGYQAPARVDRRAGTALAGVAGVLATFGIGIGLIALVRRRHPA
jgi:cobalt/nickel transport system permease protein